MTTWNLWMFQDSAETLGVRIPTKSLKYQTLLGKLLNRTGWPCLVWKGAFAGFERPSWLWLVSVCLLVFYLDWHSLLNPATWATRQCVFVGFLSWFPLLGAFMPRASEFLLSGPLFVAFVFRGWRCCCWTERGGRVWSERGHSLFNPATWATRQCVFVSFLSWFLFGESG